jgi:hypothetical protein
MFTVYNNLLLALTRIQYRDTYLVHVNGNFNGNITSRRSAIIWVIMIIILQNQILRS